MQNSMMDFGSGPGGGPMISGKWINKKTGLVVNVRDSFMDDSNNMVLMTDKGQLSMEEFSKYYIQASDEVYDESGKVVDTKPVNNAELGIQGGTVVSGNEAPLVADDIYSNSQPASASNNIPINNFNLIDKIFKKIDSRPIADLNIEWFGFPSEELMMLVNYFDVELSDIATYISKNLINENLLKDALTKFLADRLK